MKPEIFSTVRLKEAHCLALSSGTVNSAHRLKTLKKSWRYAYCLTNADTLSKCLAERSCLGKHLTKQQKKRRNCEEGLRALSGKCSHNGSTRASCFGFQVLFFGCMPHLIRERLTRNQHEQNDEKHVNCPGLALSLC
mmetsp:Transcript_25350/g.45910  ORF Transcript_25350/g.45910 Transcript_25350/m.45910 type:complete len:137 (-) Transcript_25350:334-744(-)